MYTGCLTFWHLTHSDSRDGVVPFDVLALLASADLMQWAAAWQSDLCYVLDFLPGAWIDRRCDVLVYEGVSFLDMAFRFDWKMDDECK